MLISKTIEIDMGHRVPNHKSKCRNIHGHRWKIEVGVDDKVISESGRPDEGMVIDFGDVKELMMKAFDEPFDHGFMMYKDDPFVEIFEELRGEHSQKIIFTDFIPTSENLAAYFFELISPMLQGRGIALEHVKIWETPNSTSIFTRKNWLDSIPV